MGDYCLVRVGVSSELMRILQERVPEESGSQESTKKRSIFPWQRRREAHIAEKNRQQRLLEDTKCRQDFLQQIMEDRNHSYIVTEEPVPFLEGWEFRGYYEEEWVMHIMQYATLNHFVILGKAECIPRLMLQYVQRMKSLKWVLLQRQYGEAEEELVEEIYEEYGLAVEVRLLEEEGDWRRMRLACKIPMVLVDFCEEEKISAADVARGSIWLDMNASEVKRCRLEDRNTGIAYFSLKKEWKRPQNALYQLDTNSKNGYNT